MMFLKFNLPIELPESPFMEQSIVNGYANLPLKRNHVNSFTKESVRSLLLAQDVMDKIVFAACRNSSGFCAQVFAKPREAYSKLW